MSLDPRAVAALGIGYGPLLVAYAGLWNVEAEVEGVPQGGGGADDVFDAPHKAYVKRIRKARLAELDAARKPELEPVPVRTPEPVSEQRITLPDTSELAGALDLNAFLWNYLCGLRMLGRWAFSGASRRRPFEF